jgi:hypothetical protein
VFDRAIGKFSHAYADRNEADHATLVQALKSGKVKADIEAVPARKQTPLAPRHPTGKKPRPNGILGKELPSSKR